MRAQHMGTGSKSHPIRDLFIGLLIIFGVMTAAPTLGAPDKSSQQLLDWTVISQRGYNTDWQCWILRLNRVEGPQQETSGDFCAKDKADYDAHPSGTSYQTKGDWFDNLTPPNERPQSDHT